MPCSDVTDRILARRSNRIGVIELLHCSSMTAIVNGPIVHSLTPDFRSPDALAALESQACHDASLPLAAMPIPILAAAIFYALFCAVQTASIAIAMTRLRRRVPSH